jgi:hypothetical protein
MSWTKLLYVDIVQASYHHAPEEAVHMALVVKTTCDCNVRNFSAVVELLLRFIDT